MLPSSKTQTVFKQFSNVKSTFHNLGTILCCLDQPLYSVAQRSTESCWNPPSSSKCGCFIPISHRLHHVSYTKMLPKATTTTAVWILNFCTLLHHFSQNQNWFLAWQFESESLYTKMPFRASHHQQITNHRHHWQGVAFFSAPQACWDVEIDSLDVAPLLHPHLPSRGGWKSCTQIASPRLNQIKEALFQSPGEWVDLVTRCLSGRRAMMTIYLLVWTHLVQPTKTYSIAKQGWSYQVLIQLDNAWNHKPNEI